MAPGLIGNYMLQLQVQCFNQTKVDVPNTIVELIFFYSGFVESVLGSTALLRGILSEADVAAAVPSGATSTGELNRMIGNGFWDKFSNALGKASSSLRNAASNPLVQAAAEKLAPLAQAALGHGAAGAGYAGAGGYGRSRMAQRIV